MDGGSHIYYPEFKKVSSFSSTAKQKEIVAEQGMYAASIEDVQKYGGPITQSIIAAIPNEYLEFAASCGKEPNIDVRVHTLARHEYPASPGWHVDAPVREVEFKKNAAGSNVSRNLVGTVSSETKGVSNTEFINERVVLRSFWEENSPNFFFELDHQLRESPPATIIVPDGQLTEFTPSCLHRVSPAVRPGSRLFVRVSLWHKPEGHKGGMVKSEQIYGLAPRDFSSRLEPKGVLQ